MDNVEAERLYASLKAQLNAGQITQEQFISGVNTLRYQDFNGVWWTINGADGSWLKWNGTVWESTSIPSVIPVNPVQQSSSSAIKGKRERNWIGIGSFSCSLLALLVYPYLLALIAIILGIFSLYKTKKVTGNIAYTSLAGIIIAVFVIILNYSYIALMAPNNLPPI